MSVEIFDIRRKALYASDKAMTVEKAVIEAVKKGVDLTEANLASDYRRVDGLVDSGINVTRRTQLSAAKLSQAKLHGACLDAAALAGADLRNAELGHASMWLTDFSMSDLRGAALDNARARSAKFGGADLRGANLRGANLAFADLTHADLREADLREADLRGANLTGATLDYALTAGSKLNTLSKWKGASFVGTTYTPARLGWIMFSGWITILAVLIVGLLFWGAVTKFFS